jgi:predicted transcriptional regulator
MTRADKLRALNELLVDLHGDSDTAQIEAELSKLEEEESVESIRRGIRDVAEGRTVPAAEVHTMLRAL